MKPPMIQITSAADDKPKTQQDDLGNLSVSKDSHDGPIQSARRGLYKDLVVESNMCPLPQQFNVRYLGRCPTDGLWGIEHTQKQVETIINSARLSRSPSPNVTVAMTEDGVTLTPAPNNRNPNFKGGYLPLDCISYGVQDIIYTRVFAMIIINDSDNPDKHSPFYCVAFACDSADMVHQMTQCLAEGFRRFATNEVSRKKSRFDDRKMSINLRFDPENCNSDA